MKRLPIGMMLAAGACSTGEGDEVRSTPSGGPAAVEATTFSTELAFQSAPAAFRASLSPHALALTGPSGGDALTLRLEAWGRADALRTPEAHAPQAEPCPAEDLTCLSRMTQAHGAGLTAWWVGRANSVEQGWTLERRPEGEGALQWVTQVEGAEVLERGEGAQLITPAGRRWSVSAPIAWGADGQPAPAMLEAEGDRLIVRVDDRGVTYPLTVDPVFSTPALELSGPYPGEGFGEAFSFADVNGDGYDDLLVGSTDAPPNGTGAVYVYYGTPSGVPSTPDDTLAGVLVYYYFGADVSGAGDVNGDGYEDIIVGAVGNPNDTGRAYVFHGSASGLSATADATLSGAENFDYFGARVAGAGDVNGDGYDDVIVGAYRHSYERGRAYLFLGSASGVDTTAASIVSGHDDVGAHFGLSLDGVGDSNGDGYDDVIIGANRQNSRDGRVYLYYGGAEGLSSSPWWVSGGSQDYLGRWVTGAGDVNGDGYNDVLIGNSGDELVLLLYGSRQGVDASNSLELIPPDGRSYGQAFDGIGDVDGDGYDDVALGGYETASGGYRVWVMTGGAAGLSTTPVNTLSGDDVFANRVRGVGDLNGDGYADLGVSDVDSSNNEWHIDLFWGYVDADGDGDPESTDCDDADASRYTGAQEQVGDGVDSDCDGTELCYLDGDDDGYRQLATVVSSDADCDDSGEASASEPTGDCDDSDAAASPDGVEVCDDADVDEDCDGLSDDDDDDTTGLMSWYADDDGDGFGAEPQSVESCEAPEGSVADSGDCDDDDASVYPGAPEQVGDGVDQDCDGSDAAASSSGDDTGIGEGDKDGGCSSAPGAAPSTSLWLFALLLAGRRRYTPA